MGAEELQIWSNHFEHHAVHQRCADGLSDVLTAHERKLIARSIATFQLGEQSSGRTLLRAAEGFAHANRMPRLPRIIELLIREEQGHAALLQTFMRDHRIPPRSSDWTDRAFRFLRRLAGLQFALSVLICAELVGNVYYRALESVTACERLQVLCRSIVSDELAHIGFESQLLLTLWAGQGARSSIFSRAAHRIFFAGTGAVVWLTHRRLLQRAGHSGRSFLRACMVQYDFYLEPTRVLASSPEFASR